MNGFDCGKNLVSATACPRDQRHNLTPLTPLQKNCSKTHGSVVWEATTKVQTKTPLFT